MAQYPLINGAYPDWSSIEADVDDVKIRGLKSINYKGGASKGNGVYGTGSPDPLGYTTGTNEYSGDVEMYLPEFYEMIETMGRGWGNRYFDITISFTVPDGTGGSTAKTDILKGVKFIEPDASQSQGADAITRKLGLQITKILYGGIDPVPEALSLTGQ